MAIKHWHDKQLKAEEELIKGLDTIIKRMQAWDLKLGHNLDIADGPKIRQIILDLKAMKGKYGRNNTSD